MPVYLTVYDLDRCWNSLAHRAGLGLYRSGLELDSVEYTYNSESASAGAEAASESSGVTWHAPLHESTAGAATLRERRLVGRAPVTAAAAHEALRTLALSWAAADYHALESNCHHWCAAAAAELGLGIPRWIHGLVRLLRLCTDGGAPHRDLPTLAVSEPLCGPRIRMRGTVPER